MMFSLTNLNSGLSTYNHYLKVASDIPGPGAIIVRTFCGSFSQGISEQKEMYISVANRPKQPS
jgi:hypothetical protein